MPSKHLILSHPLLLGIHFFLASGSFPMRQFFASGGQSTGVAASLSVLLVNNQDWYHTSMEWWLHGHRRDWRSCSTFKVRSGGSEEIYLVQGKEQWLCFAGAALKWYPMSKVRGNPSKMVGVARRHQRADTLKQESQKSSKLNHTRATALSNSMRLSRPCGASHVGWVMVKRSDSMWSTGKGRANHFSILALRSAWAVWNGKMIGYWKRSSPG